MVVFKSLQEHEEGVHHAALSVDDKRHTSFHGCPREKRGSHSFGPFQFDLCIKTFSFSFLKDIKINLSGINWDVLNIQFLLVCH